MKTKSTLVPLAVSALLFGVAGCGSPDEDSSQAASTSSAPSSPADSSEETEGADPSPSPPEAQPVVIDIKDFEFTGPDSVAPGATITVENADDSLHSVTADDGDFDVVVEGGATATFTAPNEPGTYSYICKFHPEMVGTLVVK